MAGKPTETDDLNLWELVDSGPIVRKPCGTDLSPLHLGENCVAWSSVDHELTLIH